MLLMIMGMGIATLKLNPLLSWHFLRLFERRKVYANWRKIIFVVQAAFGAESFSKNWTWSYPLVLNTNLEDLKIGTFLSKRTSLFIISQ
jgi:hypothetical protein